MAAEITDSDFFFRQIFKSPETMQEFLQDPANMEVSRRPDVPL